MPATLITKTQVLIKWKISLAVALASGGGFLLYAGGFSLHGWGMALGVFLASGGACGLNQVQERHIDALMERTRRRPLPAGHMTPLAALFIALLCLLLGVALLLVANGVMPALLAAFAAFWYNGVYTPLKKKTAFAVLPGAWVGALAPLVGWSAAGGSIGDPSILSVALFLALWQMPHFWLLLLMHSSDYERAGLPVLTRLLTLRQIAALTFLWILAAAATPIGFVFAGLFVSHPLKIAALIPSALLVAHSLPLLRGDISHAKTLRRHFHALNIFALANGLLLAITALSTA